MHKTKGQKWVEFPDCLGDDGEIPLVDGIAGSLENATIATCKNRHADAAVDGVNPDPVVPDPTEDPDMTYDEQWE